MRAVECVIRKNESLVTDSINNETGGSEREILHEGLPIKWSECVLLNLGRCDGEPGNLKNSGGDMEPRLISPDKKSILGGMGPIDDFGGDTRRRFVGPVGGRSRPRGSGFYL